MRPAPGALPSLLTFEQLLEALNQRQRVFVQHYLTYGNKTEAAKAAGYKSRQAESAASRLSRNVKVAATLAAGRARIAERWDMTREKLGKELERIGFADMGHYLKVDPDGEPALDVSALEDGRSAALAEVTVDQSTIGEGDKAITRKRTKFRLWDKRQALVDIAKLCGFWRERQEVTVFDHEAALRRSEEERQRKKAEAEASTRGRRAPV